MQRNTLQELKCKSEDREAIQQKTAPYSAREDNRGAGVTEAENPQLKPEPQRSCLLEEVQKKADTLLIPS